MKLDQEKLPIIYEAIKKNKVDAWLIAGKDTAVKSEPVLPVLGEMNFNSATALIFTEQDTCLAVVSSSDAEAYRNCDGINEVVEYTSSFEETIREVLNRLKPAKLALDICSSDASSDGLTYGMARHLEKVFDQLDHKMETVSAFGIISEVRGRKTSSQIEKIRDCAIKADEYLRSVPSICKKGTTSLDIFNYLHDVAYADGYGMSWADSQCPSVAVDPNVPAGHMGIISTPIVPGYLINIDYGVSKDGYCSDLQRMYYVLKEDEDDAPQEVKEAFYLVRDAIEAARQFMKPGVTGFEVDQVARHMIVDMGFDSWNAALGHQVGHQTHDGGTILANRRARYNRPELIDTPLQLGNVFTLEPGVRVAAGKIGIEEDVVITDHGTEFLVEPQKELILIRI